MIHSNLLPPELVCLALVCLLTALMWIPYVLNRIARNGLAAVLGFSGDVVFDHAPWANRAKAAHTNAVENLVTFAAIVLLAHAVTISTPVTILAAQIYLAARLVHYVVYLLGIPLVRTLAFAAGWAAQLAILAVIFHLV